MLRWRQAESVLDLVGEEQTCAAPSDDAETEDGAVLAREVLVKSSGFSDI